MLAPLRRLILVVSALSLLAGRADAADFIVNNTSDATDATPGDGVCETATGNGICTLRAAVLESNALGGPDTVAFAGTGVKTYTLGIAGQNEQAALQGDLDITDSLVITGNGAANTLIDGGDLDRIFDVFIGAGAAVAIHGLTVQNGTVNGNGGGLRVTTNAADASVLVDACVIGDLLQRNDPTFFANRANTGGGLENVGTGTLTIQNSTIAYNRSNCALCTGGGGILNTSGALVVRGSTIKQNGKNQTVDSRAGGGIYVSGGTLDLISSTVSENFVTSSVNAYANGGGIANNAGIVRVVSSTIRENQARNDVTNAGYGFAGGLYNGSSVIGSFRLKNSIVADNVASGVSPDCHASLVSPVPFISDGYNLLRASTQCSYTGAGTDLPFGTDPLLAALQSNGGPTETYLPQFGSPVIDAGDPLGCTDDDNNPIITDQRGLLRGTSACDIGAVEMLSFIAQNGSDLPDNAIGDGACNSGGGVCTLRAAVQETNFWPGADHITLLPASYTVSIAGAGEDAAATGDLDINDDLTISGAGQALSAIVGGTADRLLQVRGASSLALVDLSLSGGASPTSGGAVQSDVTAATAVLSLLRVLVSANTAAQSGGGVSSSGPLSIDSATLSGNHAPAGNGGAIAASGTTSIVRSTINGNDAQNGGGVSFAHASNHLSLTNVTISGNTASGDGGGLRSAGSANLKSVTVTQNSAAGVSVGGGGIAATTVGTVALRGNIIAGNSNAGGPAPDCAQSPPAQLTASGGTLGYDLIGNNTGCAYVAGPGDNIGTGAVPIDPKLGALADNGGPTLTHLPLAGSLAGDRANPSPAECPASGTSDQRGVQRPQGFTCDIGAVESQSADLAVSVSNGTGMVTPGATVIYTVVVSNAGPSGVKQVALTDAFPALLSAITWTCVASAGSACNGSSGTGNLARLVDVRAGGTVTFTVTATLSASAVGTLDDTASVSSSGSIVDGNPANDNATDSDPIAPIVDVDVSQVASANPIAAGTQLGCTMTVVNHGPAAAPSVSLLDPLPAGADFVSATSSVGTCALMNGNVTCDLGTLAAAATAAITVVVTPNQATVITNAVTVTTAATDTNLANNASIASVTVIPATDLALTMSATPDPVMIGGTLTYSLSVLNNGPSLATNVVLTDTLPEGASLVTSSASAGVCTTMGQKIICTVSSLAALAKADYTLIVQPTQPGQPINSAIVDGDQVDTNVSNNAAASTVTVPALADLAVSASAMPDPAIAGQLLTYTIVVKNNGPGPASGFVITDGLGASFKSVTSDVGACTALPGVVTCNVPSLAVDATVTVTLTVTPDESSQAVVNSVSVVAPAQDPSSSNNEVATTTAVIIVAGGGESANGPSGNTGELAVGQSAKKKGCGCRSSPVNAPGEVSLLLLLALLPRFWSRRLH